MAAPKEPAVRTTQVYWDCKLWLRDYARQGTDLVFTAEQEARRRQRLSWAKPPLRTADLNGPARLSHAKASQGYCVDCIDCIQLS